MDQIASAVSANADNASAAVTLTEQAAGLEQINRATGELDRVTQSNSAAAEQSAAASQQLGEQTRALDSVVEALGRMVTGAAASESAAESPARSRPPEEGKSRAVRPMSMSVPPVASVIPLDSGDLAEF